MTTATVRLWGTDIGYVSMHRTELFARFEYDPRFVEHQIETAPLMMPLIANRIYQFQDLKPRAFNGLPGLLADSLPDRYGQKLINVWLARSGRKPEDFNAVDRLCYVGKRGMGALEFRPAIRDRQSGSVPVNVTELVDLANTALAQKEMLSTQINPENAEKLEPMRDILRVGTSAGGARAKAIIAWNEKTGAVRSGQVKAPEGFGYWLIKFDGVEGNRDKELNDPQGFGKIEYAYYRMALAAGLEMSECRLFHENGRSHFMTRRFDRTADGRKIFMQSLCGIAHMDFNQAGAYGYEQALDVAQRIGLEKPALKKLFRRMTFNVMARNQDDHTKNIAFLMNQRGEWRLAPAFDIIYCYNPNGAWTRRHQMSVNGKHDHFEKSDFYAVAKRFGLLRKNEVDQIMEETAAALTRWPEFAAEADIPEITTQRIASHFRRF